MIRRLSQVSGREDQQLVQYLLGLLPPEEAERLDEAGIADDDVAARLRIVEHDLVDDYVRGTLTGETLKRFESHYLSSPRRREHVAFARRFVPAVDRAAVAAASASRRSWTVSKLASRFLVAAALVLVASGVLLFQTARLSREGSVAQGDGAALNEGNRELEQQPPDLRADNPTPARDPERAREPAAAAVRDAPAVALLLLPQTRSIDPVPTLTIPAGADRVEFDLRLESNDFSRYQVGLRDPAVNKIVWRSDGIAATSSGDQPSVRVAIPAGVLKPQHYSLDLTGRSAGGSAEVAGSYVFEILPR